MVFIAIIGVNPEYHPNTKPFSVDGSFFKGVLNEEAVFGTVRGAQ